MSQTDGELLNRAVKGDNQALSALLRRHGPPVEASLQIGKIWQTVLEPADVMQVTYLEAFLRIGTFDLDRASSFQAWLWQIAENNLRDAIRGLERKKKPQPRDRVKPGRHEDSLVGLYNMLGSPSATPSRKVGNKEACQMLETCIQALPSRYATVIRLYDLEGQPIDEVARTVGKSTGAVHMLRARAHDRLREHMGSSTDFFGSKP